MDATKTEQVVWRADVDRIAHGHLPKTPRTLCGELVIPERHAWPPLRRCLACASLAGVGVGL
jgi:hypothetical protein